MSKKCKECGEAFKPFRTTQKVCGLKCAVSYTKKDKAKKEVKRQKEEDKVWREKKRKLNDTVKNWTKKAQAEFNKYIRLRDNALPCVSCNRHHSGQYHAGHYRTTGSHPMLRFNELNCHKQCAPCNNHKSGNITEYRIEIVRRIGTKNLEWLEGPHEPARYRVEDLKNIAKKYKALCRELEND